MSSVAARLDPHPGSLNRHFCRTLRGKDHKPVTVLRHGALNARPSDSTFSLGKSPLSRTIVRSYHLALILITNRHRPIPFIHFFNLRFFIKGVR